MTEELGYLKKNFYNIQIKYLVTNKCLILDSDGIQDTWNFYIPKTKRQLSGYIGLGTYCRNQIPNFLSELNNYTPFSRPTRQSQSPTWTEESQKAYSEIKGSPYDLPALGPLNYQLPFFLSIHEKRRKCLRCLDPTTWKPTEAHRIR